MIPHSITLKSKAIHSQALHKQNEPEQSTQSTAYLTIAKQQVVQAISSPFFLHIQSLGITVPGP